MYYQPGCVVLWSCWSCGHGEVRTPLHWKGPPPLVLPEILPYLTLLGAVELMHHSQMV